MRIVMDISDQVQVLNFGERIAGGLPELVRTDPAVLDAYLGRSRNDESDHGRASSVGA